MCSYNSLITDDTDLTKLINNADAQIDLISSCSYVEMHETRNIMLISYYLNIMHLNVCIV